MPTGNAGDDEMKTTIELAREAEWHVSGSRVFSPVVEGSDLLWLLKAFEALVRADQRQIDAKVVEALDGCAQYFPHVPDIIRNRKNT